MKFGSGSKPRRHELHRGLATLCSSTIGGYLADSLRPIRRRTSNRIDALLRHDARVRGDSEPGDLRTITVRPLAVDIVLRRHDCVVVVSQVRLVIDEL